MGEGCISCRRRCLRQLPNVSARSYTLPNLRLDRLGLQSALQRFSASRNKMRMERRQVEMLGIGKRIGVSQSKLRGCVFC